MHNYVLCKQDTLLDHIQNLTRKTLKLYYKLITKQRRHLHPKCLLIHKVKFLSMKASLPILIMINQLNPKHMRNNLSQRLLMLLRTTRMICNCKYHLLLETMLSTWVLYSWDHQNLNQQELFLIQDLNISLSPVHFVMIKLQVTLNSRNMIHYQDLSCRETN